MHSSHSKKKRAANAHLLIPLSSCGQSRAGPGRREPEEAADTASVVTFLLTSVSNKLPVTFFLVNFYTLTGFKGCTSVIGVKISKITRARTDRQGPQKAIL